MPRHIDIGGIVAKLTRRGTSGRRSDEQAGVGAPDAALDDTDTPMPEAPAEASATRSGESADRSADRSTDRSVGRLQGTLARGRAGASRAADRVRDTVWRRRAAHGDVPSEAVVTVEYSPRRDGDPDPGEVVWTWVPFEEDPSQGKDRPVVIIGRRGSKLVGIPLTTRKNDREAQLKLGTGGWDPRRRKSYARIWRMLDIDADATRREGAVLDARRFSQLIQMVDRYYDVQVPPGSGGSSGNAADWHL